MPIFFFAINSSCKTTPCSREPILVDDQLECPLIFLILEKDAYKSLVYWHYHYVKSPEQDKPFPVITNPLGHVQRKEPSVFVQEAGSSQGEDMVHSLMSKLIRKY